MRVRSFKGIEEFRAEEIVAEGGPAPKKRRVASIMAFTESPNAPKVGVDSGDDESRELAGPGRKNPQLTSQATGVSGEGFASYMLRKVARLDNQFGGDRLDAAAAHNNGPIAGASCDNPDSAASSNTNIFEGVQVYVNGFTEPSTERIRYLMAHHGGVFSQYLTQQTTHYVADMLPHTKRAAARRNRQLQFVTAKWVSESATARKRLQESNFPIPCLKDSNQSSITEAFGSRSSSSRAIEERVSGVQGGDTSPSASALHIPEGWKPELKGGARSTEEDPNFIQKFFQHSRLHFLGSFRKHLRSLVRELRPQSPQGSFPPPRVVVHVDMDCFFVSVSLLHHPELRGKPVVVGWGDSSGTTNGEISSASYEARKYGIHAGMWMLAAKEKCPDLNVMLYHVASLACSQLHVTWTAALYLPARQTASFGVGTCLLCRACTE